MSEVLTNGTLSSIKRVAGAAVGGGLIVALVSILADMIRAQPERAWELLRDWGDNFVFMCVLLYVGNQWLKSQMKTQMEHVAIQQRLAIEQTRLGDSMHTIADSVAYISQKDDNRANATQAAIGFVAQQSEKILAELGELKRGLSKQGSEG